MIDGVVVPVGDAAAERAVEGRGDDLDAGLDEPAGHQELLAPLIAAVTVAHLVALAAQVKRSGGVGTRQ